MPELVVLSPTEAAAGFRLGGARTVTCGSAEDVAGALERLTAEQGASIIAVHGSLWSQVPEHTREEWTRQSIPLILGIPDEDAAVAAAHQDELRDLLTRAVGFQITFETEGERS